MAALPAAATSYCCSDENGRRICGDVLPAQCLKRAYQEINHQGKVVKAYEGPLTAEQRALREAEQARLKATQRLADEERRRDQALRASYGSIKDIDAKRDRMLAEAQASLLAAQQRYDEAVARRKHLEEEMEFYAKKAPPASLVAQIRDNRAELDSFESGLAARKQEMDAIRARFEEEKQRYIKLTGRK
jgi:hypothetical protein